MKKVVLVFFLISLPLISPLAQETSWEPHDAPGVTSIEGYELRKKFLSQMRWLESAALMNELDEDVLARFAKWRTGPDQFYPSPEQAPWAGNYNPMALNGIARRWRTNSLPESFDKVLPFIGLRPTKLIPEELGTANPERIKEYLLGLTMDELNDLSAVEKLDIKNGRYDFPASRIELEERGTLRDPRPSFWEGFCNGARAAGVCLPEPKESVNVRNADGIELEFDAADLKNLASAMYFFVEKYAQLGQPTKKRQKRGTNKPDPAVLDIAVRALLGAHQKYFFFDDDMSHQLFNRTAVAYKREIIGQEPASFVKGLHRDAVGYIDIETTVYSLSEISLSGSNGFTGDWVADLNNLKKETWRYRLYYDRVDTILMGEWLDETGPDLVWFAAGKGTDGTHPNGTNKYLDFDEIYEMVHRSSFSGVERFSCEAIFLNTPSFN